MISLLTLILGLFLGILLCKKLKDKEVLKLEKDKVYLEHLITNWKIQVEVLKSQLTEMSKKLDTQIESNKLLVSQKSSISTKNGNYFEVLSPLTSIFPVNIYSPNVAIRWLGEMTDYIAVDYENVAIYFIEIKSGDAKLSKHQKIIKKIIEGNGRIEFVELRLNSNGKTEVINESKKNS